MREKAELRKIFKQRRSSLTQAQVALKSEKISLNFINHLLPEICSKHNGKIFSIYIPIVNEVDTSTIIQYFKDHNISFCYPKIFAKDQPLRFINSENNQQEKFSYNPFYPHLLEPDATNEVIPDILITPLVAFDDKLNRLGMGGGFFDRTIQHIKKSSEIITIGLAYDLQRHGSSLALEITDQTLDFIVTESNISVPS